MTQEEIIRLLASFEKRLATIADQARETREQAQHTLDRINRLRQDLEQVKSQLVSLADTSDQIPTPPPRRGERPPGKGPTLPPPPG